MSNLATNLIEPGLVGNLLIVLRSILHFRDRVEHVFHVVRVRLLVVSILSHLSFAGLCQLAHVLLQMTLICVPLHQFLSFRVLTKANKDIARLRTSIQ